MEPSKDAPEAIELLPSITGEIASSSGVGTASDLPPTTANDRRLSLRRRSTAPLQINLSKPLVSQAKSTGDLKPTSPTTTGTPTDDGQSDRASLDGASFQPTRRGSMLATPTIPIVDAYAYARRRSITALADCTPELRKKIEDPSYVPPLEKEVVDVPLTFEGAVGDVVTAREPSILYPDDVPPDGGYGWVVVAMSFLVHFFPLGGILYTWGLFQRYYLTNNTFPGATSLQLSFIGSIGSAVMPGFGPISGRLADKYGYRLCILIGSILILIAMISASFCNEVWQMYLTQGVTYGVGVSMTYFPSIGSVPQWFQERRGLAVGLAVSGSGLGGLAMSAVVQALLSELGFRWALRIIGILGSAAGLTAALFIRTRVPPKPRGPFIAWRYFKDLRFALLFASSFIGAFGYFAPFFFIPQFATSKGMTAAQGALCVSLLNGASAVGRIVQGAIADKYLGPFNSFVVCQFMAPLSTMLIWPFASVFGVLVFYSLMFGFMAGGFISLFPVVLTIIFGTEEVATVMGTQAISGIVGNLAGPPIAGVILDSTGGNYIGIMMFSGATMLSAGVLILVVRMMRAEGKVLVKL